MKIYICANGYTDFQTKEAISCANILTDFSHVCSVNENPKLSYNNFPAQEADLIVSLGGDGSLLRAAKVALENDKPLIGINSGRLGYLCALSFDEISNFNKIINDCTLENRSVLELIYNENKYYAINDVLVSKSDFGKTVDLTVCANNKQLMKLRGDGLIISTPTGSTAYNISAGGPVLDIEGKMFAITPICAHDDSGHPHVVEDSKLIDVKVNHDDVGIYVDGEYIGKSKDSIKVNKAEKLLQLYVRL